VEAEGGVGKASSGKSRSRSWLTSEDELVRSLVAQHGPRKWTFIATRLKTKTQKQVFARVSDCLPVVYLTMHTIQTQTQVYSRL
jgi:hypothetical protein